MSSISRTPIVRIQTPTVNVGVRSPHVHVVWGGTTIAPTHRDMKTKEALAGHGLIGIGVIHTVVGVVMGSEALIGIARDGFIASSEPGARNLEGPDVQPVGDGDMTTAMVKNVDTNPFDAGVPCSCLY